MHCSIFGHVAKTYPKKLVVATPKVWIPKSVNKQAVETGYEEITRKKGNETKSNKEGDDSMFASSSKQDRKVRVDKQDAARGNQEIVKHRVENRKEKKIIASTKWI